MSFTVYPGHVLKYYSMFKQVSAPVPYERFVSKGSDTEYLTISNYISFEPELHVDCSKAFKDIINASLPLSSDDIRHGSWRQNTDVLLSSPIGGLVLKRSKSIYHVMQTYI